MAIHTTAVFVLLFLATAASALEQGSDSVGKSLSHGVATEEASSSSSSSSSSSFILAKDRTRRKDPFNGFKLYTGGWNISNDHYFASVAYTAVPLFAIAAAWFVVFGLALVIILIRHCCCHRRSNSMSSTAGYIFSLALVLLFAVLAIVGCIILYTGQVRFDHTTATTLDFVVSQSVATVANLRGFSNYLASAKNVGVDQITLPAGEKSSIDSVLASIGTTADYVSSRTSDNSQKIQEYLIRVRLKLIQLSVVLLVLVLLGVIFSLLGIHWVLYILVLVGWFLVAGTFVLAGIFLVLHNVVSDTCVAMDEWVLHPQEHTALDDILPCMNATTTSHSLKQSREVTYQMVQFVDGVITNITNVDFNSSAQHLYYNQSGPFVPVLCNPYNADMSPRACLPGETGLSNATQVWSRYVCRTAEVSGAEVCTTVGRVTPELYKQMSAAANVSFALYQYGPFLAELANCSFVRQTFGAISADGCPGMRRYSYRVFAGMVVASVAVMLSLVCWVVHAGEKRRRKNDGEPPAHKAEMRLQERNLLGSPGPRR